MPVPMLPATPAVARRAPRLVRELPGVCLPRVAERGPSPVLLRDGLRRLPVVRTGQRCPSAARTPYARVSAFPRVPRPRPVSVTAPPTVVAPARPAVRPRYIPRRLYMAGVRHPITPRASDTPLCGFDDRTQIVFSKPPRTTVDVWEAAQLCAARPGFIFFGSAASLPLERIEERLRLALSKRCSAVNTRRKVAGFASAFVGFANSSRAPFVGRAAVFCLSAFLESLLPRGP